MIEVVIKNMSCGHCQLKVNAELKLNNYKVISIDMDKNTVLIDTSSVEANKIKKILNNINYFVDNEHPILDIVEYTVWDDKLDDEENYHQFMKYLENKGINIIGFNDIEFGIIILCTKSELTETLNYINQL